MHQHKAAGVPQLVAEVAVAFAAAEVELDVAARAGQRQEGETQGVGAERRDARGEFLARAFFDLLGLFGVHQAADALFDQGVEADAIDQIDRVEDIALRLAHFLAFGVADQPMHINVPEGYLAGDVPGHHHHARDPEENDVEAGDQHGRRQVKVQCRVRLGRPLRRPVERRERPQCRRVPGVEDVRVARQHAAVALFGGHCPGFGFIVGDKDFPRFTVPGGNLMAPPQLP